MVPVIGFALGPMELAIVLILVLVLFGGRIPSTMRSLGQSVNSFKSGLRENEDGSESSLDEQKKSKA